MIEASRIDRTAECRLAKDEEWKTVEDHLPMQAPVLVGPIRKAGQNKVRDREAQSPTREGSPATAGRQCAIQSKISKPPSRTWQQSQREGKRSRC